VELALIALPMVIILLAVFEFAFMLSRYHGISKRVHEATRYLSAPVIGGSWSTDIEPRVKSMVLYGRWGGDSTSGLGLAESMIQVCRWPDAVGSPCAPSTSNESVHGVRTVSVTVSGYTYNPIFPGLNYFSIDFPVISATMPRLQ
jgi:hypothetical protein